MAMTLVEAAMYFDYAKYNPLVRPMVAAYLKVKAPTKPRTVQSPPQDAEGLLSLFGGGGDAPIRKR